MADQAIVIGVGSYPTFGADGKSSNDLPGAVTDAGEVAAWLAGNGVEVRLITSDGVDGARWNSTDIRPHATDVENGFVPYVVKPSRIANRLYVYMAGHGLAPSPRTRCLILPNARGIWVPNIEGPAWIDWFANQLQFDELVLWMDCCATQALEYSPGKPDVPNVASRVPPPAKVFMAFGSGFGRPAYEASVGPGGRPRGLFTAHLLAGLRGGGADENGEVRSASLAAFLRGGRKGTVDPASGGEDSTTSDQAPVIPHEDDMLFGPAQPPEYRIRVPLAEGTTITLSSPPNPRTSTGAVVEGHVTFALGVGLYKIEAPGFLRLLEIGALTPREL